MYKCCKFRIAEKLSNPKLRYEDELKKEIDETCREMDRIQERLDEFSPEDYDSVAFDDYIFLYNFHLQYLRRLNARLLRTKSA